MNNYLKPYPLFVIENFANVADLQIPSLNRVSRDGNLKYEERQNSWPEIDDLITHFLQHAVLPYIRPLENEFHFKLPEDRSYGCVIMQAREGYELRPHTDSRNRLVSGVLYLESDVKGGELVFCDHPNLPNLPHLMEQDVPDLVRIEPKPGTFVCWLNSFNSYHYTTPMKGTRNSLYISWESKTPIWGESA